MAGKRYSLKRVLLSWSALALGITALLVGYFLFQALTSQFSSTWRSKMEAELTSLRQTLQSQLAEDNWSLADQSLSRMATRYHVQHLQLIADGRIRLSTRRAETGEPFSAADLPPGMSFDSSRTQQRQQGTEFFELMPVTIRTARLRENQQAWLLAHYDAGYQYQRLLDEATQKVALLLGLLLLYTLGMLHIVKLEVLQPLGRLVGFTRSLRDGQLGSVIHSHASSEFAQLEGAFNSLSLHLQHSIQQIREQHILDQAFTRAFPDVAFLLDNQGIIQGRYGSGESPVRELQADLSGQPFSCWLSAADAGQMEHCRQQAMQGQDTVIAEFHHHSFYIESRMTPLLDDSDSNNIITSGVLWLIRDISDNRRKQQLIEYQANFDSLTSLANRRFALLHIDKKMAHARRTGKFGAVLFIDLDHFKNINDSLGHPTGDRLLIEMGARLLGAVRDEDMTARLGGDEFLVLFDDLADTPEAAASLASDNALRLLQTIQAPVHIDIHSFHLSASVGIAVFPSAQQEASDLIRQADTAMYHAKAQGRSGISVYTDNMQQETQDKLNLFNDLHQAISDQAFSLVFQPQFNELGQITGAEVLCRWNNRGQPVAPDVFISAAEETRLILPLGQWILTESCRCLKYWREHDLLPATFRRLAVNISPTQFMNPGFEQLVSDQIHTFGLCPSQLELEITESVFLGDKNVIRSKMQNLHALGFSFALDDFGTGYSSLSYLQHLPLDKLKIDRSFMTDISDPQQPARIVDSIIQMGHNLNMEIIAEGVETEAQRDYLRAHDCHQYQGYLFSKPLAEAEFLQRMQQHNG